MVFADTVQLATFTGHRRTFQTIHRNVSTTSSFSMSGSFTRTSATLSRRPPMLCCATWRIMTWEIPFQSWSSLRRNVIIWWDGRQLRYERNVCLYCVVRSYDVSRRFKFSTNVNSILWKLFSWLGTTYCLFVSPGKFLSVSLESENVSDVWFSVAVKLRVATLAPFAFFVSH